VEQVLVTPVGDVARELLEQPSAGLTVTREWIIDESQLPIANWISEQILYGTPPETLRAVAEACHEPTG
jgi:hypothetical protein